MILCKETSSKLMKPLAKLYYQQMWAEREQIREGDVTRVTQYSCTTACHSKVTLLQTGTSILTYIEISCWCVIWANSAFPVSMSGNWAECTLIERNIERSVTLQWWRLQTWTLRRCGAAYIFGGRKISASLVKWTKRFFEAHNLPRGFFVFELLEESFQP